MPSYIVKRTLSAIVTLFFVITLTFFIMQMVPGGPFLGENVKPQIQERMAEKYGYNRPVLEQYITYMSNLFKGDLGISVVEKPGTDVTQIIAQRFPTSLTLGLLALILSLSLGIPLGVFAALKNNTWFDKLVLFVCSFGVSVPSFILTVTMMLIFGVYLKWLPFIGLYEPRSYIMPVFGMAIYNICYITRLTRSTMLDVLGSDYVKTARAKGLPRWKVLFKHALRNALLPVVTHLGLLTAGILTGSFVIERVFSIPGLGKFFVSGISSRDYSLIMGTTIFYGVLLISCNLIVDILYGVIDPRIKLK